MDLSKHFILLNGEPKTLQIDAIQWNGSNGYSVRFKNNGRTYNYGRDKVVWLKNPEWKDPTQCKVLVDGILKNGIREIWRFDNYGHACWRVIYNNGFVQDDASGRIVVTQSCLQEAVSKSVFAYMKNVATVNSLGKDEKILREHYRRYTTRWISLPTTWLPPVISTLPKTSQRH